MPRKLSERDVSSKQLHPESRRARQIQRSIVRKERLHKKKGDHIRVLENQANKLLWFQLRILDDPTLSTRSQLSDDEVHGIIQEYLDRPLLPEPTGSSLHKRMTSTQAMLVETVRQREKQEYSQSPGLEVPKLTDPGSLNRLLHWTPDVNTLRDIPLVRVAAQRRKPAPEAMTS